jgi:2,3-bisphosphoglycerate-dependent phosphoglycerate mutase
VNASLTAVGEQEASETGRLLAAQGLLPDVMHTSLQQRSIRTAELAVAVCDRDWVPVRRSRRLNSNHYGALQGTCTCVLVVSHGNTLRALVKHLDNVPDAQAPELNIPNATPLVYEMGTDMRPVSAGGIYLR